MNIAATISRYLLGIAFLVFGLNGFLNFIPQPPLPDGLAGQYTKVMTESHYLVPVFLLQLICGVLFVSNRFIPLALTLIGPVIVNILLFHILMAPETIAPGLLVAVLWFVLFYRYRSAFTGIFQQRPMETGALK